MKLRLLASRACRSGEDLIESATLLSLRLCGMCYIHVFFLNCVVQ